MLVLFSSFLSSFVNQIAMEEMNNEKTKLVSGDSGGSRQRIMHTTLPECIVA